MPRPATISHPAQLSSYHRLVRRVNRVLNSPTAQRERQANLRPIPDDNPDDWERLLEEIEQVEDVRIHRRDDGSVHLIWRSAR